MAEYKMILDLDTGIDDALAIAYALATPESDLIGIVGSYGNILVEQGVQNSLDLLEMLGHTEVPVYQGLSHSSTTDHFDVMPISAQIHGKNGIGEVEIPTAKRKVETMNGPDFFIEAAHKYGKKLLIVPTGNDGIKTFPEDAMPVKKESDTKAVKTSGKKKTIPEGTVLGDGHIKYVLARVDTRLLHGQVATGWTHTTQPNRIIVVSDTVCHDKLRTSMIKQAAPNGVRVSVAPIKNMAKANNDPRFGDTRAMLLFESVEDALAAVKAGVEVKEINLGSSAYKEGKVNVTKALSFDQTDVDSIKELQSMGVKFDVRGVPADSPANIDDLIKLAEKKLAEKN